MSGYEAILEKLPLWMRALFITGYSDRAHRKGELLEIKWPMVDLKEGLIELEPHTRRPDRALPPDLWGHG